MVDRGMVIVGAGECGTCAAFALREEGYSGPVTLVGAEPHLPYERPPLSKGAMAGDPLKLIAAEQRFAEAGITLVRGADVTSIDRVAREATLSTGSTIPYDRLLLATGARPRLLPAAEDVAGCVYLRTHDDAQAIAARLSADARVAIIGGGFIGLELAAAARRHGAAVTVIEAAPRLLSRAVPAGIAAVIEETHRRNGVDVRTGAVIAELGRAGSAVRIEFTDGDTIEADLVVIGIGAVPNTELAAAADLAVDNGIAVDAGLATADPSIFAAGDCCSFPLALYGGRRVRLEAWRNAQEQGALAARNMLGRGELHAAVPWFWSDQYDLSLQIAGLPDEGATIVRRDMADDAFILFHLAADGRLVAASGIGPGNAVARDIRLAEMLIARRAVPDPALLAASGTKLKSLLAA